MLKGYMLGAAVALILYFTLIPKFSYWGAAISTVIIEIVVAFYAYLLIRKASGQGISGKVVLSCLPASLALVISYQLMHLPWILEITVGLIIYALILILNKAVPLDFVKDLLFLRKPEPSIVPPADE